MVRAAQRAQSRPGRSCSWRDRSWPQRQVTDTGPPRGAVRAGRPLLTGSVTVPRPRRGRTEAVYRCIEFPTCEGGVADLWARTSLSLHERNMLRQGSVTTLTRARPLELAAH